MRVLCLCLLPFFLVACVGNTYGERGVSQALVGKTVIYGDKGNTRDTALWQEWSADGTTRTGSPSRWNNKEGRWTAEGGRYCEVFGASTEWTCYRITLSAGGQAIRFWEIPDDVADLIIFHRDLSGWFAD